MFIMVGGKLEKGESGREAALREVAEEVGLSFGPGDVHFLGSFSAPAANEVGHVVECDVFVTAEQVQLGSVEVQREIVGYRWFPLDSVTEELAPLSRDVVHPLLKEWVKAPQ